MTIAILAMQGAFLEHGQMLDRLGVEHFEIRKKEDLDRSFDGLILPGGESTVMRKLLIELDIYDILKEKIEDGLPVFGTCAGMILLAQRLENDPNVYFGALDATVRRNAYGRQLGSFMATENVATFHADGTPAGVIENFPLVFIRGPFVAETGANARVMCEANGNTVALQQGRILATAFHPEITPDTRIHEFFLII